MDIQEIARLHSRYGEAPLTIDMPVQDKSIPMLDSSAGTRTSDQKPMWSRLNEGQRLAIALVVVAGIAFPIGMWAASAGKHGGEPSGSKTLAATVPGAGASAAEAQAQAHEWPSKVQTDATEKAGEPMPPGAQLESHPSLSPSAASVSTVAPSSASSAPSKPVPKAAPAPAKPPAAVAGGPSHSGPIGRAVPQAAEARPGNEIKLF